MGPAVKTRWSKRYILYILVVATWMSVIIMCLDGLDNICFLYSQIQIGVCVCG